MSMILMHTSHKHSAKCTKTSQTPSTIKLQGRYAVTNIIRSADQTAQAPPNMPSKMAARYRIPTVYCAGI